MYGVAIFPNQIQLGKGKLFKAIKHIRLQLHKSFELRTIKTQFSSDVFFFLATQFSSKFSLQHLLNLRMKECTAIIPIQEKKMYNLFYKILASNNYENIPSPQPTRTKLHAHNT